LEQKGVIFKILLQEPAYGIISKNFIHSIDLLNLLVKFKFCKTDMTHNRLIISDIFREFQPNCILTGISGPNDIGVDEVALYISSMHKNIKTFSIQSYWGDLNNGCGVIADTIFVLDKFAEEVTLQRNSDCNVVITGSLQSNRYDNIDIEKERKIFKSKYAVDESIPVIGLFGQPLFKYKWYKATIIAFIDSINRVKGNIKVVYRPHPKESGKSIEWTVDRLDQSSLNYVVVSEYNVLKVLTGTDLAVSVFSTIGHDLLNLLARSDKVFSTPMYLFFDKKCVKWYQKNCMLREIPMSKNNVSIVVESQYDLDSCIEYALTNKRMNSHVNNKQNLLNNNHGHLLLVSTIFNSCFNGEKYKPCSIT
jgi:hypothetical protein